MTIGNKLGAGGAATGGTQSPHERPWADAGVPFDERVEALLTAMSLDEKVAQLGSVWPGADAPGEDGGAPAGENVAPL